MVETQELMKKHETRKFTLHCKNCDEAINGEYKHEFKDECLPVSRIDLHIMVNICPKCDNEWEKLKSGVDWKSFEGIRGCLRGLDYA